ncbi:hypothetical protein [Arthrobacter mobilis]|uniref:Uncharacterized protein n=1 Tax=Arthrobacter mobilis TaxID=2724944 RepID=A0A7X6HFV1_9MICC|nr:hypothetical protein [Arthrobacter mobilis]NKX56266.1 hypothetical protein [Arthrobacter mobilis]
MTAASLPDWELQNAGRYWLKVARHRAGNWNPAEQYDAGEYLVAVEASGLKPKVKRTIIATAGTADHCGTTTIDRATVAAMVGCRKLDTITAHWQAAERLGLIHSRRRWNTSKVQAMTLPHWRFELADDVAPLPWPDKGQADPPF